jgi:hypothetical protein
MDLEASLAVMTATLADADAELATVLGGFRELTQARVWQGQVLVEWEPDAMAGGLLLRPGMVHRLVALHAHVEAIDSAAAGRGWRLRAPGHIVSGLSPAHAELVARLGGARRIELTVELRFSPASTAPTYTGGRETYAVVGRGHHAPLVDLSVQVRPRAPRPESARTSPAPE